MVTTPPLSSETVHERFPFIRLLNVLTVVYQTSDYHRSPFFHHGNVYEVAGERLCQMGV